MEEAWDVDRWRAWFKSVVVDLRVEERAGRAAARVLHHDAYLRDDAVQETLIALWRSKESLRHHDGPSFLAWVAKTARNKSIDLLRKRRDSTQLPLELRAPGDVEDQVVDAALALDALQALRNWSSSKWETYRLVHLVGLPRQEVAARLGKTYGTIRTELWKARRFLKEWQDRHLQ